MTASLATLATLARLRQRELEIAREDFADRLDHEKAAAGRVRDAAAAIHREQDAAASIDAADAAVDAFAAWLPVGRRTSADAERDLMDAEGAAALARGRLNAARAAAEAADKMRDGLIEEIRVERDRKLQAELDEAGLRPRRGPLEKS